MIVGVQRFSLNWNGTVGHIGSQATTENALRCTVLFESTTLSLLVPAGRMGRP